MKDDRTYLLHIRIRDSARWVAQFVTEGKSVFLGDRKTQNAVIRELEIIGEAVKNLSSRFREAHSQIPWGKIAGMRDKMIHEYFGVNLQLVWEVVERDLAHLKEKVEAVLRELGKRREAEGE